MARRYGVPPWALDNDDPLVARWINRGWFFHTLEAEASHKKKGG